MSNFNSKQEVEELFNNITSCTDKLLTLLQFLILARLSNSTVTELVLTMQYNAALEDLKVYIEQLKL